MAIEQYTESITLQNMKCVIGANSFGYVFPQGDVSDVEKVERLLKKAGGKPKLCALDDYSLGGKGKALPEFIITFNDDVTTIIVVECKKSVTKHASENLDHPKDYAVDGALYYAKFLKEEYNVIALAVSGTKRETLRSNAYLWSKGQDEYTELRKARDIILEPKNYIDLVKGKRIQREYSLDSIRETAIDMHEYLREIKMTERHKPIFIAGILIALNDSDFAKSYINLPSFNSVISNITTAIDNVLGGSGIKNNRITYIKQAFINLLDNSKFSAVPLGNKKSIIWYIEELEMKIKPMMDHADSTIDALGVFYHEFIKYSGGDGSGLGIVLTPQHLTEFMCDLAEVNKNSRVVDICCGSGSFLVTAMSKMFANANAEEIEDIRQDSLYGVEFDDELYTLAVANMIIRKDGKSNVYFGDCFDELITAELKGISDKDFDDFFTKHKEAFKGKKKDEIRKKYQGKNINIGLINPPYSQDDVVELEFVEHLLDILTIDGTAVVVVPMSCAIGTKFKDVRNRLFTKHTLDAVFSMPDDIFYPTGTNVCVMVWKAHRPHDSRRETFFGYCKNDGFVKRKKLGRIDAYGKWSEIEARWLDLYRNRDVEDGLSARHKVTAEDEWLCEAYMKTDYKRLTDFVFEQSVRDYLSFQVKNGITTLCTKYATPVPICLSDTAAWKEMPLSDLFVVSTSKDPNLQNSNCGSIPYISSSADNNGLTAYVDTEPSQTANTMTIARNGSVGSTFFQPIPYAASPDDVRILTPRKNIKLNVYSGLFIKTVIEQEKFKYAYGRKLGTKRIEKVIIKLPVDQNGAPDFEYMEQYIKSLPYSDRI